MKNILLFLSIFLFALGCNKSIPPCENGRYDEGEIGIDCGGSCADCVFDKNDILNRLWTDVLSDLLAMDDFTLLNHSYAVINNKFHSTWIHDSIPGVLSSGTTNWEWVNESDTLEFPWVNGMTQVKRKIMFVGEGFYKFKTDLDGWKFIYIATF